MLYNMVLKTVEPYYTCFIHFDLLDTPGPGVTKGFTGMDEREGGVKVSASTFCT